MYRVRPLVTIAALAGCYGKPAEPLGADASGPADAAFDACVFGAWTAPQPLTSVNTTTADERSPFLTPDGKDLYFIRSSNPHYLRHMHRDDTSIAAFFGFETLMDLPAYYDLNPHFSDDMKRVWLTTAPALNESTLQFAERPDAKAVWPNPQPISELDVSAYEQDASLTVDELTMVYATARQGSIDLFVTRRTSPGDPWSTPVPIDSANSGGAEISPWISADGSFLLFASNRDGSSTRIYQAQRLIASQPESFGPVSLFPGAGDLLDVQDPFLSRDGRLFLFTQSAADIWYSERSCL